MGPRADAQSQAAFWRHRSSLIQRAFATLFLMSITATVEAGKIVLSADVAWPSGTVVRIEPVDEPPPALLDTLKDFDGMAGDLPADLAANLVHYVHGL